MIQEQTPKYLGPDGKVPYDLDNLSHVDFWHPDVQPTLVVKNHFSMRGLVAAASIEPGTLLHVVTAKPLTDRTIYTVQVGEDSHTVSPLIEQLNHSCSPNTLFRSSPNPDGTITTAVIAHQTIRPGEEIVFDYATTERQVTDSASLVVCDCAASVCRGALVGYDNLETTEQARLFTNNLLESYLYQAIMVQES